METVSFKPASNFTSLAERVFQQQKKKILEKLPMADIQHIGSTAIPDSLTKGDLDVNVRVAKENFTVSVDTLKKMYEINQPHNWTPTYASFKDDTGLSMPFGIQLTVIGSPDDVFISQRDILLNRPDLVEKLNKLKVQFEGKSMDEYRKAKGVIFTEMIN